MKNHNVIEMGGFHCHDINRLGGISNYAKTRLGNFEISKLHASLRLKHILQSRLGFVGSKSRQPALSFEGRRNNRV